MYDAQMSNRLVYPDVSDDCKGADSSQNTEGYH
jgi:hypothetical protein